MWAGLRKPHLPLSPKNARALLCADHTAKHLSAAIRSAIAHILQNIASGKQSGAIKGGGTGFPMFIASFYLVNAARKRISAALHFC